jgi:hypothetical protein
MFHTVVDRAGDAADDRTYPLIAAMPGLSWATPRAIILHCLVWTMLNVSLGRAFRRRSTQAEHGTAS